MIESLLMTRIIEAPPPEWFVDLMAAAGFSPAGHGSLGPEGGTTRGVLWVRPSRSGLPTLIVFDEEPGPDAQSPVATTIRSALGYVMMQDAAINGHLVPDGMAMLVTVQVRPVTFDCLLVRLENNAIPTLVQAQRFVEWWWTRAQK